MYQTLPIATGNKNIHLATGVYNVLKNDKVTGKDSSLIFTFCVKKQITQVHV